MAHVRPRPIGREPWLVGVGIGLDDDGRNIVRVYVVKKGDLIHLPTHVEGEDPKRGKVMVKVIGKATGRARAF